jgi:hypothetical protein
MLRFTFAMQSTGPDNGQSAIASLALMTEDEDLKKIVAHLSASTSLHRSASRIRHSSLSNCQFVLEAVSVMSM